MINILHLDGRPGEGKNRRKSRVDIDGVTFWLTLKEFSYLAKLAFLSSRPTDWIAKDDLEPTPYVDQYVWRLRKAIKGSGLEIENDRDGGYRLSLDLKAVAYDPLRLAEFPEEVRRLIT